MLFGARVLCDDDVVIDARMINSTHGMTHLHSMAEEQLSHWGLVNPPESQQDWDVANTTASTYNSLAQAHCKETNRTI